MSILKRITVLTVLVQMFGFTSAWALDRNAPNYMDRLQFAKIVAKLRTSIQQQQPELIATQFYEDPSTKQELSPQEKAERNLSDSDVPIKYEYESVTISTALQAEICVELDELFSTYNQRKTVRKPVETYTNTWNLDVVQKNLEFSNDMNEAWLDLNIGNSSADPDSAYLYSISEQKKASLSDANKKTYLRYWPIHLHLVKKNNIWMIASFDELRNFKRIKKESLERIILKEKNLITDIQSRE